MGNAGGVDHWAGTPASTGLRSRHPAMYWDRLRWWLAVVLGMSCHSEEVKVVERQYSAEKTLKVIFRLKGVLQRAVQIGR